MIKTIQNLTQYNLTVLILADAEGVGVFLIRLSASVNLTLQRVALCIQTDIEGAVIIIQQHH